MLQATVHPFNADPGFSKVFRVTGLPKVGGDLSKLLWVARRVVLASVFTRSFRVRAMAAHWFLFAGTRSVGTLDCPAVDAAVLLFVRGAAADGIASTHATQHAARK
jgi:hypothetical protein